MKICIRSFLSNDGGQCEHKERKVANNCSGIPALVALIVPSDSFKNTG
jgi:hypothetical protein